jgi:hypothetical protein
VINDDKEGVQKHEEAADRMLKNYSENMFEPVKAFITFANEEGYLRAMNVAKRVEWCISRTDVTLYGHPIYFKPAPEPSNIIWEDQYTPPFTLYFKSLITGLIIFSILIL